MVKKKGLGKGLGALLEGENSSIESENIVELKLSDVEPNLSQPRKVFDEEKLAELSASIAKYGVLSPILVCEGENGYHKIIAGERRWRAAKLAGLKTIPAIIKNEKNTPVFEIALVENLQREDLNPVEEALGYRRLMTEFGLTQEEVGEKVSKSRSGIANSLRLLKLPGEVLSLLEESKLSVGHAKVLLSLDDENETKALAKKVCDEAMSVRELEGHIKSLDKKPREKKETDLNLKLAFEAIEKNVSQILGTKVKILDKANKGKIQIEYYSAKDLERIVKLIENK